MKKKLLLASTLIASQLFAESINFDTLKENPTRVAPNNQNQILSFNQDRKSTRLNSSH